MNERTSKQLFMDDNNFISCKVNFTREYRKLNALIVMFMGVMKVAKFADFTVIQGERIFYTNYLSTIKYP